MLYLHCYILTTAFVCRGLSGIIRFVFTNIGAKIGIIIYTTKKNEDFYPQNLLFIQCLNKNNMESSVKQRLMEFINYKNISIRSFENTCGLSNGYMKSLRKSPTAEKLRMILDVYPELNERWVTTGAGLMTKDSKLPSNAIPSMEVEEFEYAGENKNDGIFFSSQDGILRMSVPHVPFAARAEFANLAEDLEPHLENWEREVYIVDKKVNGKYLSFDVKGDSMDNGMKDCLEDGDKVLVRELERDFWRDLHVNEHKYWVLVFGSSILIKQILSEDVDNGTIVCHSLNPSPEYHDFTLNLDDVRLLYYVVKIKPKERSA